MTIEREARPCPDADGVKRCSGGPPAASQDGLQFTGIRLFQDNRIVIGSNVLDRTFRYAIWGGALTSAPITPLVQEIKR
jgi:hypothetical protein